MASAQLILNNGYQLQGSWLNPHAHTVSGEVVFTTAMTGYEETLTDPSYAGQIVVFTFPLLGNYGVGSKELWESTKVYPRAIICSSLILNSYHHLKQCSLLECLIEQGVAVISDMDTRALTKVLRDNGTMFGTLSNTVELTADMVTTAMATTMGASISQDWVAQVSCTSVSIHGTGRYKIILVDFGIKQNIIRELLKFDVRLKLVPYDYDYSHEACDGIFLSNGPGDPQLCHQSIQVLRVALTNDIPIFGICLGAQLLGLAAGANTYKLKFGHRGHNQPVQEQQTMRCYLTSQNHGYALDEASLPEEWRISFRHLHDNSVAGISHKSKPQSAVQFHPEAASGPQDTAYLFSEFMQQVQDHAALRIKGSTK